VTNGLTCSENFLIQELFGDNFQVREWHANGLPGDKISTDNALIMQKSKQYCLCIDPQQQALPWLKM
jgi:dynein heavy chain